VDLTLAHEESAPRLLQLLKVLRAKQVHLNAVLSVVHGFFLEDFGGVHFILELLHC